MNGELMIEEGNLYDTLRLVALNFNDANRPHGCLSSNMQRDHLRDQARPAMEGRAESHGPHKTLYNRFVRWSLLGVFDRIFMALATEARKPERIMIDATHLKAHRTAASLAQKGAFPAV